MKYVQQKSCGFCTMETVIILCIENDLIMAWLFIVTE